MNGDSGEVNAKQRRLIVSLLSEATQAKALESAGVSFSTLARWRKEPAFAAALAEARRDIFTDGYNRLLSEQGANLDVMARLRDAEAEGTQLRAAVAWEQSLVRRFELAELADLEQRIAALEAKP